MNEKEYKKSLKKLLKTLFKKAENPFSVDGQKVFNEFELVKAISLVERRLGYHA